MNINGVESAIFGFWQNEDPDRYSILLEGKVVGSISWRMFSTPTFLNFEASVFPSGFCYYQRQIPRAEIFPIAFISDLEVYEPHRQRGVGKAALRSVLRDAQSQVAAVSFIRVGWASERDKNWKVEWYQREGFILLNNEKDDFTVPCLWHPLANIALPEQPVTLQCGCPHSAF